MVTPLSHLKTPIIISGLIGLACGIVARKSQAPPSLSDNDQPVAEVVSSRPAPASADAASLLSLSWGIRGNLSSADLLALPHGGRLLSEMTLWSLKATPAELAEHWDRVIASGEDDMNTLDHLMILWVRRDPEGALAHLQGGDEEYRCYWALAGINPEMALDLVDPNNSRLLTMVLRAIGQTDPEYAMALMEKYPNHESYSVTQGIAEGLSESDPAKAVAYSALQEYFETDRFRWWLVKDPQAAFEWSLTHQSLASSTLGQLLPMLMAQDPDYFAQKIAGLPTGKFKIDLLKAQAQHLATKDPQQALAFAKSQEGPQRLALMEAIGASVVAERPEFANALLDTLLKERDGSTKMNNTFNQPWVQSLMEDDPSSFFEKLRELPSTPVDGSLGDAERAAFNQWLQTEANAGIDWVLTQDSGERRDGLLYQYLQVKSYQEGVDYEELIAVPGQLSNESQRTQSARIVLSKWNQQNPEELKSYIESNRATPEQVELYQTQIQNQ